MTQLYQCCVDTITKASAIGFTLFGCKQCHRNFEILPEQTEQHLTPTAILQETCDHDWEDVTAHGDIEQHLVCTYCGKEETRNPLAEWGPKID